MTFKRAAGIGLLAVLLGAIGYMMPSPRPSPKPSPPPITRPPTSTVRPIPPAPPSPPPATRPQTQPAPPQPPAPVQSTVFVHIDKATQIKFAEGVEQCWHITGGAFIDPATQNTTKVIDPDRFRKNMGDGSGYCPAGFGVGGGRIIIDLEKHHAPFSDYLVLYQVAHEMRPGAKVGFYWNTGITPDVLDQATQLYEFVWCQLHGTSDLGVVGAWIDTPKKYTDRYDKPLVIADEPFFDDGHGNLVDYEPQLVYNVLMVGRKRGGTEFGLFMPRDCAHYDCSRWIDLCQDVAADPPRPFNGAAWSQN